MPTIENEIRRRIQIIKHIQVVHESHTIFIVENDISLINTSTDKMPELHFYIMTQVRTLDVLTWG